MCRYTDKMLCIAHDDVNDDRERSNNYDVEERDDRRTKEAKKAKMGVRVIMI